MLRATTFFFLRLFVVVIFFLSDRCCTQHAAAAVHILAVAAVYARNVLKRKVVRLSSLFFWAARVARVGDARLLLFSSVVVGSTVS